MLRGLGVDAISIVELGLGGADDSAVREAAISEGRILVTLDADFANVIRFPPEPTPGIIRLKLHPAIEGSIASALRRAAQGLQGINLAGKLATVDHR